jgi:hypothetical protein
MDPDAISLAPFVDPPGTSLIRVHFAAPGFRDLFAVLVFLGVSSPFGFPPLSPV